MCVHFGLNSNVFIRFVPGELEDTVQIAEFTRYFNINTFKWFFLFVLVIFVWKKFRASFDYLNVLLASLYLGSYTEFIFNFHLI